MTHTDPLREALARLADETRLAEEHLDRLAASGASFGEQFAAAGSVTLARREYDAARGSREGRAASRVEVWEKGSEALSGLFADAPSPALTERPEARESAPESTPATPAAATPPASDFGATTPEEAAFVAALNGTNPTQETTS